MITDPDLTPVSAAQNDQDLTPVGPSSDPDLNPVSILKDASGAAARGAFTVLTGLPPEAIDVGKKAVELGITASKIPSAGVGGLVDLAAGKSLPEAAANVEDLKPVSDRITDVIPEPQTTSLTKNVIGNILRLLPGQAAEFSLLDGVMRGGTKVFEAIGRLRLLGTPKAGAIADAVEKTLSDVPAAIPEAPPPEVPQAATTVIPEANPIQDAATRTRMAQNALSKVAPTPEPFQSAVSEKTTGSLVDQVAAMKDSPIATDTSKRAFTRIMDLIERGEISESQLAGVAEKHGIQPVELAAMVGEEFSRSGRILNKASRMVRALNAAFEGNPEAIEVLGRLKPPDPTAWQMIADKIRGVESLRRRLLVTQLATTARNVSSQATRFVLQGIDDALTGATEAITGRAAPKQAFANALEDVMAVGRTMSQGQRRTSLKILDQFPTEAARLLGTPVGDVSLTGKAIDVLNAANTAQEYFFRRLMIDARIMGYLRGKGVNVDVGADLAKLPKIPEKQISQFVGEALEATFAKTPGKGSFTDAILQTYNRLPFLTALGNPFPRFWANSMEFMFQHSPLGFTRLLGPGMRAAIASGDSRAASQAVSRAMLGTTMLGLGYALREGPWAGPRWYQVKMGDGKMLDIRPFAPFSTYAFLAEAIREAQGKAVQMTPQDYFTALVGINRITGSGLVVVDAMRAKDWQGVGKFVKSFAGEWAGSFSTPIQTAQDIAGDIPGSFGERERTLRSSREDPLTGPFRRNIPGLSQTLPAQPSAFEPSPVVPPQGRGILRQATGVSIRDYGPLEMAAEQLGIRFQDVSPKTGDPMTDRLVLEKMGLLSQKIGPGLLNVTKNFKDPEEAKAVFLQFMSEIKRAATEQVMAENQKFAIDQKGKGQRGLKRILFQREVEKMGASQ